MKPTFTFGTYNVPSSNENLTASFTVPGILSKEMMEKIMVSKEEVDNEQYSDKKDEVTHEHFFGENIQRVKQLFSK